jgi:glucokinase
MTRYIGIDLGGTNLRAAIADTETGQIFHQLKCPTQAAEGQEAVIKRIVSLIRDLTQVGGSDCDIRAVGIGVPGTPDIDAGVIESLRIR